MSARDWLDCGLKVLAAHGAPALTIERLTEQMGLSKGSFYHHFGGMPGYRTALLGHYQDQFTLRYIELVERGDDADPLVRLDRLREAVLLDRLREAVLTDTSGAGLEVAIRAWAAQDDEARGVLQSVDATRIDYLRELWFEHSCDPIASLQVARSLYLLLIGASHVVPPLPPSELRGLYELTLRAVEPPPARPRRK